MANVSFYNSKTSGEATAANKVAGAVYFAKDDHKIYLDGLCYSGGGDSTLVTSSKATNATVGKLPNGSTIKPTDTVTDVLNKILFYADPKITISVNGINPDNQFVLASDTNYSASHHETNIDNISTLKYGSTDITKTTTSTLFTSGTVPANTEKTVSILLTGTNSLGGNISSNSFSAGYYFPVYSKIVTELPASNTFISDTTKYTTVLPKSGEMSVSNLTLSNNCYWCVFVPASWNKSSIKMGTQADKEFNSRINISKGNTVLINNINYCTYAFPITVGNSGVTMTANI